MKAHLVKRLAAGGSALLLAIGLTSCNLFKGEEPAQSSDSSLPATTTTTSSTTTTTSSTTTTTSAASGTPTAATLPPDGTLPAYAWVTADSMHIRSGPGTDYEAIGGTKYGERLQILAKEGDWYKIQILGLVGYVSGQYLSFTEIAAN